MKRPAIAVTAVIAMYLLGFIGCTPKTRVDLIYQPAPIATFDCRQSIAVAPFQDNRSEDKIGETQKGEPITATTSVGEWVSKTIAAELGRAGCLIEYDQAGSERDTDMTLSGDIGSLKMIQIAYTQYDADMRLNVILENQGRRIFDKAYYGTLTKKTFPSSEVPEKVLTELLQVMVQEIIPDLRRHLE
jgi:hypothetical protein